MDGARARSPPKSKREVSKIAIDFISYLTPDLSLVSLPVKETTFPYSKFMGAVGETGDPGLSPAREPLLGEEVPDPGTGMLTFLIRVTREMRIPASATRDLPGQMMTFSPLSEIGLVNLSIQRLRSVPSPTGKPPPKLMCSTKILDSFLKVSAIVSNLSLASMYGSMAVPEI